MKALNIALLGFAQQPLPGNQLHAAQLGRLIVQKGWTLVTGNHRGTMGAGLTQVHEGGGNSLLVLEREIPLASGNCLSHVYYADDQQHKHRLIARYANAAVVIGGGSGSLCLSEQLLKKRKPVFAIRGSGGIVNKELSSKVLYYSESRDIVETIETHLADSASEDLVSHA